jgi:acyl carrier protein phosphodiesterase
MNFLAHLFLSGNDKGLKVGNFIADAVKGKEYLKFDPAIQKGIILHRAIDQYTDDHPIVKISKQRVREHYGKHAGIVIDIFYDHFLSVSWERYSNEDRLEFIKDAYILMINHYLILPSRVKQYLPFMVVNNWLEKYKYAEGMERVLTGMSRRTSLPVETANAMKIFHESYEGFQNDFNEFFPQLVEFVRDKRTELGVPATTGGTT